MCEHIISVSDIIFHVGPLRALIDIPGTKDYHLFSELRITGGGEKSAHAVTVKP
jgi:hypothetical protein